MLGGAVAGLMIDAFGLWSPFLLDTVSYVGVIVALLAMRVNDLHAQPRASASPGSCARGSITWASRELRVPCS